MQLLKITTTPIEYKLEVENATLKAAEKQPGTVPQPNVVNAAGTPVQGQKVRRDAGFAQQPPGTDTRVAAQAYGPASAAGRVGAATAADAASGEYTPKAGADLDNTLAQIPSGVLDRSWEPEQPAKEEAMVERATPLADAKRDMEYSPSEVRIDIESMPKVDIEYIGSPQYFPRSADPDYEPPAEEEPKE